MAATNETAIRIQAIIDVARAIWDDGKVIDENDGAYRNMAEWLGVPFLVFKLAADLNMDPESLLTMQDILDGLAWMKEHDVPVEMFRHPRDPGDLVCGREKAGAEEAPAEVA